MPTKYLLKDFTWVEFRERMKEKPVMLVPLGSQEEQGPHAPMGDFMLTEKITEKIARAAFPEAALFHELGAKGLSDQFPTAHFISTMRVDPAVERLTPHPRLIY